MIPVTCNGCRPLIVTCNAAQALARPAPPPASQVADRNQGQLRPDPEGHEHQVYPLIRPRIPVSCQSIRLPTPWRARLSERRCRSTPCCDCCDTALKYGLRFCEAIVLD